MNTRLIAIAQELLEIANQPEPKTGKVGRPKGAKNKKKRRMSKKAREAIRKGALKRWKKQRGGD